jgi:hypothetical protein
MQNDIGLRGKRFDTSSHLSRSKDAQRSGYFLSIHFVHVVFCRDSIELLFQLPNPPSSNMAPETGSMSSGHPESETSNGTKSYEIASYDHQIPLKKPGETFVDWRFDNISPERRYAMANSILLSILLLRTHVKTLCVTNVTIASFYFARREKRLDRLITSIVTIFSGIADHARFRAIFPGFTTH